MLEWFFRLQNIQAFVPAGTMAVFVSATPPDGWVECDGQEYDKVKFPQLYKAIGTEFTATTFKVPATGAPPEGSIWMIKV